MTRYEYTITRHEASEFMALAYFCTETGECSPDNLASDAGVLSALLNDRGAEGWELVQISFGKREILVFWKRVARE